MIKSTVGMKLGLGFGLALMILVIIGSVAYRSTEKLTATAQLVTHTHQVLETVESALSLITDAETSQRGFLLVGEERFLEPYVAARSQIDQKLAALRDLTKDNPNQQRRLDVLEPLIIGPEGKFSVLKETIEARKDTTKTVDTAQQLIRLDQGKKLMDEIRKIGAEMKNEEQTLLTKRSEEAEASASGAKFTILYGTAAAFVILGLAGFILTRHIAEPLKEISANAGRIAVGDLSLTMTGTDRSDEVGLLAQTFARMTESLKGMAGVASKIAAGDLRVNVHPQSEKDLLGNAFASMVENLQRLTTDLMEGVNVLGSAANEISASTTQLASSATESATAVSETTTTVEEVRQTSQMASQKAKAVSDIAQQTTQISQVGRKSAQDAIAGVGRIRQQMESIAGSMVRLSEQGQAIGQIIATVEDLAAQSNLLAVNAAIEAAKAGEHGKGFGVVAQEVKSLAEQSRQATNQVRTILGEIQKATAAAVMATEQGNKAVETGGKQTEAAGESIQTLATSVSEAAQAATQIAASSQQQLVGMDQVALAMESIKQASTQNVASAKQLDSAARNLSELGQRLKKMVERYKV